MLVYREDMNITVGTVARIIDSMLEQPVDDQALLFNGLSTITNRTVLSMTTVSYRGGQR